MASRRVSVPFKEIKLKIIGPSAAVDASRVQRFDVTTNLPSTDIDELGNNLHAGTTTGTPEISTTFSAMDVSTNIFAALTGNLPAYPATGVSITNLKNIDVLGEVKDDAASVFAKYVHGRQLRITGFTYTYTVGGEATEEYTAQGTEKRWFKNYVLVEKFTTGTTSFSLAQEPKTLKNGNKAVSVIMDGVYLTEVASSPATGEYSISGSTLTTFDSMVTQLIIVYHNTTASNEGWSYIHDVSIPAGIRGKFIPVTIGVNDIKRVQSVTIRGNFPNTKVEEMGNTAVVGYTTSVQQVTGDISVLDTDNDLVSIFTNGNLASVSADTEYSTSQYTASGISLTITLKDPVSLAVRKTLYIPALTITSEGHATSVGGNATQTFGFKSTDGDLIIYSGAKP